MVTVIKDWLERQSDYVFEAVGGITGQPLALAAATQVLAVRTPNVNVPLLPLTAAACPCTYLSRKERKGKKSDQ